MPRLNNISFPIGCRVCDDPHKPDFGTVIGYSDDGIVVQWDCATNPSDVYKSHQLHKLEPFHQI